MSKPTRAQFESAVMQGEQARRNGRKEADCPFRESSTEPLRTLKEGWLTGFQREAAARGKR